MGVKGLNDAGWECISGFAASYVRYLKTREYTYFFREQNEHVFLTYHEQK